jgi:hypothetical protein
MVSKSDEPDDTLPEEEKRAKRLKTGIGIGIGSAAVMAALLYANHARKKKPGQKEDE